MRAKQSKSIVTVAIVIVSMTQACSKPASTANDDYSANVQAGLQLNRTGKWNEARVLAEKYLASTQGLPSSQERCAMLVSAAYSNAILHENAKGDTQLRAFSSACEQYPLRFGWHIEAGRVRRLLNGENAKEVYHPSSTVGDRSSGAPPAWPTSDDYTVRVQRGLQLTHSGRLVDARRWSGRSACHC